MDIEKVREYCVKKMGVSEGFPFGEDVLVFKVMNKMFCLMNINPPSSLNLKCDPEMAAELRERYPSVTPGYHMNKTHWNSVILDGTIPDREIFTWIDQSYELIVKSLPKKEQTGLKKK
ncbi:MAG: MmcQ/YjbR family DNA-binding protein [Melioribacteraceae bacterium]